MISESQKAEFSKAFRSSLTTFNPAARGVRSAKDYIDSGLYPARGVVCDNDCGMMIKLNIPTIKESDRSNMVYIPVIKKVVCMDCYDEMVKEVSG